MTKPEMIEAIRKAYVNQVVQGDCFELMERIPTNSIDLIITDPPYGTTQNKWDTPVPLDTLWGQFERIIKDQGAILIFAQTPFDKKLGASNLKLLRYEWIWEKTEATGHLNAKRMPMKAHENILVFYKNLPLYFPQKTYGHKRKTSVANRFKLQSECYGEQKGITQYDSTERYPRSVIKMSTDKQKLKLHPTQKPLALIEYFIKTYSKEGDLVFDPFMGSWTTAVACKNTNRNFIGFESEEKYCRIGKERLNAF